MFFFTTLPPGVIIRIHLPEVLGLRIGCSLVTQNLQAFNQANNHPRLRTVMHELLCLCQLLLCLFRRNVGRADSRKFDGIAVKKATLCLFLGSLAKRPDPVLWRQIKLRDPHKIKTGINQSCQQKTG